MIKEDPGPDPRGGTRKKGTRNAATLEKIKQLHENPGEWFVWCTTTGKGTQSSMKYALLGKARGESLDWHNAPYEITSRSQPDGLHKIYVRYLPEKEQHS